jgi:Zn-finger nucleic acid-binding protein
VPADPKVHYLPCPQCGKLMSRMNYAVRSGVIMDVCRTHGIWLDRDEIREIIEFIRSGGLDRARRIEKEELEEARKNISFEPANPVGPIHYGGLHESLDSDERVHLLHGIAALANQFLGDRDATGG